MIIWRKECGHPQTDRRRPGHHYPDCRLCALLHDTSSAVRDDADWTVARKHPDPYVRIMYMNLVAGRRHHARAEWADRREEANACDVVIDDPYLPLPDHHRYRAWLRTNAPKDDVA